MAKASKELFSISCRMVGPGGTTVTFYATPKGLKCIWTNENCPYDLDGVEKDPNTYEASDGHNVSMLSWDMLKDLTKAAEKYRNGVPGPQPKKVLNK